MPAELSEKQKTRDDVLFHDLVAANNNNNYATLANEVFNPHKTKEMEWSWGNLWHVALVSYIFHYKLPQGKEEKMRSC